MMPENAQIDGIERFRAVLEVKRAQLSRGLRQRDEIAIERTADLLEETQLALDRELIIRNLHRDSTLLRQVNAALGRIADGTYGVCLRCEEPINLKRLLAVPWAAYCVRCQEQADREQRDTDQSMPRVVDEAA